MPMMNVRVVSVPVNGSRVQVWMRMRLNPVPRKIVHVLVVRVMPMRVRVFDAFVDVLMFVLFGQMQPETQSHQCRSDGCAGYLGHPFQEKRE